jgi:hypothetical protein
MDELKLTDEERNIIAAAKNRAILSATQADKAVAEAKVAELEYRNIIQQIFIRYGLTVNDTIEEKTGIITVAKKTEQEQV